MRMKDIYDEITGALAETPKNKIFREIALRLIKISNGCETSGGLLQRKTESVNVPPKRISGSGSIRSKYYIGLEPAFSEDIPLVQSYKLTRGTRLYKLVGLAIDLFDEARRISGEIEGYVRGI